MLNITRPIGERNRLYTKQEAIAMLKKHKKEEKKKEQKQQHMKQEQKAKEKNKKPDKYTQQDQQKQENIRPDYYKQNLVSLLKKAQKIIKNNNKTPNKFLILKQYFKEDSCLRNGNHFYLSKHCDIGYIMRHHFYYLSSCVEVDCGKEPAKLEDLLKNNFDNSEGIKIMYDNLLDIIKKYSV